jgi:hypothetical protein
MERMILSIPCHHDDPPSFDLRRETSTLLHFTGLFKWHYEHMCSVSLLTALFYRVAGPDFQLLHVELWIPTFIPSESNALTQNH